MFKIPTKNILKFWNKIYSSFREKRSRKCKMFIVYVVYYNG